MTLAFQPVRVTQAKKDPVEGLILNIQRLSTEDGPGLRTTVFFKGCPLSCAWCHNPESISAKPQVQWLERRCIGDLNCLSACPELSLTKEDNGIQINRITCTGCGLCVEACPTGAMELLGKRVTTDELLNELAKDSAYFGEGEGGVTLSGGEPTLQPGFSESVLLGLKKQGISTALDTCGLCSKDTLDRLMPYVDLVLFDLKILENKAHRTFTGQDNKIILENLDHLVTRVISRDDNRKIWIRTPLIPGSTDSESNIKSIGGFLATHYSNQIERWELCSFNNLCKDKYQRLDMTWNYAETTLMDSTHLGTIKEWAIGTGFDPKRIFITGSVKQN